MSTLEGYAAEHAHEVPFDERDKYRRMVSSLNELILASHWSNRENRESIREARITSRFDAFNEVLSLLGRERQKNEIARNIIDQLSDQVADMMMKGA